MLEFPLKMEIYKNIEANTNGAEDCNISPVKCEEIGINEDYEQPQSQIGINDRGSNSVDYSLIVKNESIDKEGTEFQREESGSRSFLLPSFADQGENIKLENEAEDPILQDTDFFNEIFKCKYCSFETKHKKQLWGHMQVHDDNLDYKNQDVTLYYCPQCDFQTIYKYSLTKHLRTHKTEKFNCLKCSFRTWSTEAFKKHCQSHDKVPDEVILGCDQCNFKVKTKALLLRHKKIHVNQAQLLKCPECDLTTMYSSSLKRHIRTHQRQSTEKESYDCQTCSFKTSSKTMLIRHEKIHVKESEQVEIYQCSQCEYRTMNLPELESHIVEIHQNINEDKEIFHCTECLFKTTNMSKINWHKNIHLRQNRGEIFKCELCNYESMYKYLLKRHSLIHKNPEELKMFQCDSCEYKAKTKDRLGRHKRVHMKKEELSYFKCSVCVFQTIYKHTFRDHLARHNISLMDVKKFLSGKDNPDVSNSYFSEQVLDVNLIDL